MLLFVLCLLFLNPTTASHPSLGYPSGFIWSPHWVHAFPVINETAVLEQCPTKSHRRAACLGKRTEVDRLTKQIIVMDIFITPEGIQGIGFLTPPAQYLMSDDRHKETKCVVMHNQTRVEVLVTWMYHYLPNDKTRPFTFFCPMHFPSPIPRVLVELIGPAFTMEPVMVVAPPAGVLDANWWSWPPREVGRPQLRAEEYKSRHPEADPNSIAMAPLRIGGCAGNLFSVDVRVLIQWIEFHRLIGMSVFVMYALFPTQPLWAELVDAYADDPEITVIVVAFSQVLMFEGLGHFQQFVASMHCQLLTRGLADHVMLFDPDELITPLSARGRKPGDTQHPMEWASLPRNVLSWESRVPKGDRLVAIFRPLNFFGQCVNTGQAPLSVSDLSDTPHPLRFSIEHIRVRCNNPLWWYSNNREASGPTEPMTQWPDATREAVVANNVKMMVDAQLPFFMRTTHEIRNSTGAPLRSVAQDEYILYHYRNVTSYWFCGYKTRVEGNVNFQAYKGNKFVIRMRTHYDPHGMKFRRTFAAGLSIQEHDCIRTRDDTMLVFAPFMRANVRRSLHLIELWKKAHQHDKK